MQRHIKFSTITTGLVIYCGLPLLLYVLGDHPRREVLKESFSLLFIVAFSLMLGLFFLSRSNRKLMKDIKMSRVVGIHKFLAYLAVTIFMAHPILLVVPRFFESGVEPLDAFWEIFTSFDNLSVILGIVAYALMLLVGITSFIRKRIPFKYTTWRLFHGVVVMLFVPVATWHVLMLGRHMDTSMSIYMLTIASLSIIVLTRTYLVNPVKE